MNANLRELAQRGHDGLEITLYWDPRSNEVSIEVVDRRHDSSFRLPVDSQFALDAFHHPYAYAPATDAASEIAATKSTRVIS